MIAFGNFGIGGANVYLQEAGSIKYKILLLIL